MGNEWRISRVVESVTAPDTLSVRHIVLSYSDDKLADSLFVALKGGADFAQAAAQNSLMRESAANGSDLGAMPFQHSQMSLPQH